VVPAVVEVGVVEAEVVAVHEVVVVLEILASLVVQVDGALTISMVLVLVLVVLLWIMVHTVVMVVVDMDLIVWEHSTNMHSKLRVMDHHEQQLDATVDAMAHIKYLLSL
jgi:hypothetical protein